MEEVVAHDPGDVDEVAAIRDHLQEEETRFARGDFSDHATHAEHG